MCVEEGWGEGDFGGRWLVLVKRKKRRIIIQSSLLSDMMI